MMSQVIRQEAVVFLISILHGAGLTLLYDLLRALRRSFVHNLFVISAEDFLFWLTAGFCTFCLVFLNTAGVIRGYVAAGIALGSLLYHAAFSHLVVTGISRLLNLQKRMFGFVRRILSFVPKKIWGKRKKGIEFARKRGYNIKRLYIFVKQRQNVKRGRRHDWKKKTAEQK